MFAILQYYLAMLSTDELKLVAAIVSTAQLPAAARELQWDHSTVFRRLNSLEKRLGTRLFERTAVGYVPTAAGKQVQEFAARWLAELDALTRNVSGAETDAAGRLRVTTTEDVAIGLMPACISHVHAAFPALRIESIVDNRLMDLSRREADVAIRPTRKPPEGSVGVDLGRIATAIYVRRGKARARSDRQNKQGNWAHQPWIARTDAAGPKSDREWVDAHVSDNAIVATFSGFSSLYAAANAGIGAALLPCFVAEQNPLLMRISPPIKELTSHLWLLCDAKMRRVGRVRAFFSAAAEQMRATQARISWHPQDDKL